MKHSRNIRIIKVFKLFNSIKNFNAKYNFENIYNNLESSKYNNNAKAKGTKKVLELLMIFAFYIIKSNFDNINTLCIISK